MVSGTYDGYLETTKRKPKMRASCLRVAERKAELTWVADSIIDSGTVLLLEILLWGK